MKTFDLELVTPDGPAFRGPVERLVLPAWEGLMGVLPGHEPMVVMLKAGPLRYAAAGKEEWMAVSGGFARIARDRVAVLADTAEQAAAIDAARARSQAEAKQQALGGARRGDPNYALLEAGLRKELVRLKVSEKGAPAVKILTWNVNGVRAVMGKGFLDWLASEKADVVCLQEIKATLDKVPPEIRGLKGWHTHFFPARKPGYSGVALLSREKPDEIWQGLGDRRYDEEGRVLGARFGNAHVVSAYFPNSQEAGKRLDLKVDFCRDLTAALAALAARKQEVVLTGDYNIAHERIDLARPDANGENPGFFPQERRAMTEFLASGFVDVFRQRNPGKEGLYTWWSYRGGARQRNVGWRIDYTCVTPGLVSRVRNAWIEPHVNGSDHCPVGVDLR